MNKLNRNISNIINNYIKPLHYLKELQEIIKDIKYDDVYISYFDYMKNAITKENNKWIRENYILTLDYRINYLQNKQ